MLIARLTNGLNDRPLRLADGLGRHTLALSIALRDSEAWLNVVLRRERPPSPAGGLPDLPVVLGLSLAAVLDVGLLLLRPLVTLAAAARAAGCGDRTARVPERWGQKLRETTSAFNDM